MIGRIKKHPFFFGIALLLLVSLLYALLLGFQKGVASLNKRVGVINVSGEIFDSALVLRTLDDAAKDDSIKAIVLRIDSPGGGVAATQEIYAALKELRTRKPIVASLGSVAASGGYYIACGANKIIANPGTLTGSISAAMFFYNSKDLLDKIGIRGDVIKGGKYKDIGSPIRRMTNEETVLLQGIINDVSEQFVSVVVENRNITRANIASIADGRIFTGRQALILGLVDELGGLSSSIKVAAKLANIEEEPQIVEFQDKRGRFFGYFLDEFFHGFAGKFGVFPKSGVYYLLSN